jgi:hypothetical protein
MVRAVQRDPSVLPTMRWSTFIAPVVALAVDPASAHATWLTVFAEVSIK